MVEYVEELRINLKSHALAHLETFPDTEIGPSEIGPSQRIAA